MKTTHKGDKYLDFKHVFLHRDFEMHFPPHCVEQKKLWFSADEVFGMVCLNLC